MRIALIAPPFISVPPKRYGGTELFLAELASGLQEKGVDLLLYTNGESQLPVPRKWLYEREEWPLSGEVEANLKALNHSAWAVQDAIGNADIIHMNNAPGLTLSRFCADLPFVYTVHHAFEPMLSNFYELFPRVSFVTISEFQRQRLSVPRSRTIHHGIGMSRYRLNKQKQPYLCFLGRVAPVKGTDLAIEIAKRAGIALKIAGEIQPVYQDYWENKIKPHVDGRFIEYVGEVGLEEKNELLGNATAMLFPIQWDEPFGLVMIEAMACGTPVLALSGGSVEEIVREGVSGHIRRSVDELAGCAKDLNLDPETIRRYAETFFSRDRMASDYIEFYSDILGETYHTEAEPIVA
jgi:glycosyltransferase involved in cell wall biosynthesis